MPKVVKYIEVVLELVRACKYGASYHIQVYALPMWHASVATVYMSMSESILFTANSLRFYLITHKCMAYGYRLMMGLTCHVWVLHINADEQMKKVVVRKKKDEPRGIRCQDIACTTFTKKKKQIV